MITMIAAPNPECYVSGNICVRCLRDYMVAHGLSEFTVEGGSLIVQSCDKCRKPLDFSLICDDDLRQCFYQEGETL